MATWVEIIEDCRDNPVPKGTLGQIEDEEFFGKLGDEILTTPRIRLMDGSVIYGCECWWKEVDV